jgi:hypothetical protein
VKFISESLEEKEREDFSRMKVIKTQKALKKQRLKIKNIQSKKPQKKSA